MPTPTTDKLKTYYPGKQLVADGGALTEYVADSGTLTTIVDAALTEADDYFNGGIVFFSGDTTTVALQGVFAHIKDFDAASDTITLAKSLPAAVATGDTYTIVIGGNYRSSTELMGAALSGVFPELKNVVGANVTGVTIKYASPELNTELFGFPQLELIWDQGASELSVDTGGGPGPVYSVVGDASDVLIFDDLYGYVIVDVVQASLPGSSQSDFYTLSFNTQSFVPDIEGYESTNPLKGKTRYRLQTVKNTDGADPMTSSAVYIWDKTDGNATSIVDAQSLGLDAGQIELGDASFLPVSGFWLFNISKNDCRYITGGSGNFLECAAANGWTKILCDANNTVEPLPGDTMTSASGGSGIIDAIRLHSGTWAGGDANATIYLKGVTGTFLNTDQLQVSAVNIAIQSGGETVGLRDRAAVAWDDFDNVVWMADIDIAVETPTANQFSDPATETEYPNEALDFTTPGVIDSNLPIGVGGNMAIAEVSGVWFREWIMDEQVATTGLRGDLVYEWS